LGTGIECPDNNNTRSKDEDKFNPDTSKPLFCVVSIVMKLSVDVPNMEESIRWKKVSDLSFKKSKYLTRDLISRCKNIDHLELP
jgi:hypothetical protein